MKLKWLDRHLVTGPHLALCTSKDQYVAALEHLKIPKRLRPPFMSPKAEGTTTTLEGPGGLVCLVCIRVDKKRCPLRTVSILVHEAVHVWQAHRDRIGEDTPSEEFEAYAIESIAERLITAYPKPKE